MDPAFRSDALFAIALSLCVFLLVRSFLSAKAEPPGPGLLQHLLLFLKKPQAPEIAFQDLSQKYGSVFSLYLGFRKVVVMSGWKTVKAALNHNAMTEKDVPPIIHDLKLHHGIVFANGPSCKEMRQFSLNNMKQFGMGRQIGQEKIMEEVQYLMEVIDKKQGKAFNTFESVTFAVANVISSIVFGRRFEYNDPKFVDMVERIHKNSVYLGSGAIQLYNAFPKLFNRSKQRMQLLASSFANRRHIAQLIEDRQETLEPHMCRCLVDSFLLRKKQLEASGNMNSHYHEDNLQATTINLFSGGTESTSSTIQYGLLLMAKYPEIQDQVQEELDRVIGSRPIRAEDKMSLPFTQAVVHETQRLLSVFPMLVHSTSVDVTFQGYHIKKGTPVFLLMSSAFQDEAEWEKPHSFNPAHFLDKEGNLITRAAFFPFAEGQRLCIGQSMAKMTLLIFFASLLQRYRFSPPPGVRPEDVDLGRVLGLTHSPVPHQICAVQRN